MYQFDCFNANTGQGFTCFAQSAEDAESEFRSRFDVSPADIVTVERVARASLSRVASREEQHGRYLDCGPGAWDDR